MHRCVCVLGWGRAGKDSSNECQAREEPRWPAWCPERQTEVRVSFRLAPRGRTEASGVMRLKAQRRPGRRETCFSGKPGHCARVCPLRPPRSSAGAGDPHASLQFTPPTQLSGASLAACCKRPRSFCFELISQAPKVHFRGLLSSPASLSTGLLPDSPRGLLLRACDITRDDDDIP